MSQQPFGGFVDTIFKQPQIQNPAGNRGTTAPTSSTQGGGIMDALLGYLDNSQQENPLADIGSLLGSFSSGEKADRVVEGNFQGDYDRMMLDREANQNRLGYDAVRDRNLLGSNRENDRNRMGLDLEDQRNRMGLDAQDARNRNETDALKKLQQTAYIAGGGTDYKPQSIQLGGSMRELPAFAGIAPTATTDVERQGAMDLQGQVRQRLQDSGLPQTFKPSSDFTPDFSFTPETFSADNSYVPKPVDQYAQPGLAEKIGSYGAVGSGILGALGLGREGGLDIGGMGKLGGLVGSGLGKAGGYIGGLLGLGKGSADATFGGIGAKSAGELLGATPGSGAGSLMGGLLGKGLPIAGIAAGGIGLMKDRGTGKNIMNGMQAGAGIGSMVAPGIGTAVGAGAGALAGWLRGVGGPSEQEMAGRDAAGQSRQALTAGATPQQLQEAQSAGWQNPQDALTMIVLRDKVLQSGGNIEQANQLMAALYNAEKGGPEAVQQVIQQIMQTTGGMPPGGQVV